MKLCIQKGFDPRTLNAVINYCMKKNMVPKFSEEPLLNHIPIGNIHFVQKALGRVLEPEFFPEFTKNNLHRRIWRHFNPLNKKQFIKSAIGYKDFPAYIYDGSNLPPHTDLICSDVVEFVNEWRYYIAGGEVLCSWWYKGNDETADINPHGPELPFNVPKDFYGTVDLGLLNSGKLAVVECHHPIAIGWYGEVNEPDDYIKFTIEGFFSLIEPSPEESIPYPYDNYR